MVLSSIIYVLGISLLLYIITHAIVLIRVYTRPSTLPRYLHAPSAYALITGASDGIGLAFAHELIARGFNLILHGRNHAKLSQIRTSLLAQYPGREIELAIANAAATSPNIDAVVRAVGDKPVTVLVNNVGGQLWKPPLKALRETTTEEVDENINLNARFPVLLTREMLPVLERNSPALILNMSSLASLFGAPLLSIYAGAKAFNSAFSDSLRVEMQMVGKDIEVLGIMIGQTRSASVKGSGLLVISSRELARAALDRVGCGLGLVYAAIPHLVASWVLAVMPPLLQDWVIVRVMKEKAVVMNKEF